MSLPDSKHQYKYELLTRREETDLLAQVAEHRRIKEIEARLPPSAREHFPQTSLAQKAGYECFSEVEEALEDGQMARDTLVLKNMRLVHHVVNKAHRSRRLNSLSKEDLVQEGTIGLVRAIEKYDPEKKNGGRFATYATYWIRASVLRLIAEKDDIIRSPEHVTFAINKIRDAARNMNIDLEKFTGKDAMQEAMDAKKLAEASGLTGEQFEHAMRVDVRRRSGGFVEMQVYHDPGFKGVVGDVSSAHFQMALDEGTSYNNKLVEAFSSYLKPREMEVLGLRYGIQTKPDADIEQPKGFRDYEAEAEEDLFGTSEQSMMTAQQSEIKPGKYGEHMSFQEVSKRVGVSAEYCRRLCGVALKKLRQAAEDGQLDPALFGAY